MGFEGAVSFLRENKLFVNDFRFISRPVKSQNGKNKSTLYLQVAGASHDSRCSSAHLRRSLCSCVQVLHISHLENKNVKCQTVKQTQIRVVPALGLTDGRRMSRFQRWRR